MANPTAVPWADKVRKLNPFCDISDPMEWQLEIQEDRPLLDRD